MKMTSDKKGPALFLHQVELGPMQNFIYLIGCEKTREAAVVDPAWDVQSILAIARNHRFHIKTILLTHTHFDHINGVEELLKQTDARVFVHKKEAAALRYAGGNIKKIESGDAVKVGELNVTFIHTPGHTPGSQCFYVEDRLITGDTLFINGCGRCDLPGGSPEEMYHSLTGTLKRLDDHTQVYPGHHYAPVPVSTIGDEKRQNPFLTSGSLEEFLRRTMGR
ncbi:MAG TPA: MBL fold metallo-hydrolase [Nitrospiria bacterium]|nr:MBL fold metallo-hydrolase [Nitrospiria bacterium]